MSGELTQDGCTGRKYYSKTTFELLFMEREPNGVVFFSSFGLSDYTWKQLLGLAEEWDCRQHRVVEYALLLLPPVQSPGLFTFARMELLSQAKIEYMKKPCWIYELMRLEREKGSI